MNHSLEQIKVHLENEGWFQQYGAYVLVDGQYGSTGKGVFAAMLAEMFANDVGVVTTNAGPNSGHTSYFYDEKVVLKQLPTFSVIANKMGEAVETYLNAGAIIDLDILRAECAEHGMNIDLHPHAALIDDASVSDDASRISAIGSTGKGTGPALARKIGRDPKGVVESVIPLGEKNINILPSSRLAHHRTVFVEVSQGYSLGLNSGFYPYTTSRECTVMQALSDAAIHPYEFKQSMMVVRTYPIRVAGNSGRGYSDQAEVTWEMLGVEPELTTVTQKVRRVFTWSKQQFKDAVRANKPLHICLNFVNYLEQNDVDVEEFIDENVIKPYTEVIGHSPRTLLLGYGPKSKDVKLWEGCVW